MPRDSQISVFILATATAVTWHRKVKKKKKHHHKHVQKAKLLKVKKKKKIKKMQEFFLKNTHCHKNRQTAKTNHQTVCFLLLDVLCLCNFEEFSSNFQHFPNLCTQSPMNLSVRKSIGKVGKWEEERLRVQWTHGALHICAYLAALPTNARECSH